MTQVPSKRQTHQPHGCSYHNRQSHCISNGLYICRLVCVNISLAAGTNFGAAHKSNMQRRPEGSMGLAFSFQRRPYTVLSCPLTLLSCA